MTKQALADREQIAESIIKFAERNKLQIHPGQDPYKWADLVLKKGGCPCVPSRKHCPCAFAMEDIKELGRCRCGLFTNDAYIENYNSLQGTARRKKEEVVAAPTLAILPAMNEKAKGEFLKKISINGFSIEERDNTLILRPRGAESVAEITIEDEGVNGWRVVSASGSYDGFARGKKRSYFETYINQWAAEAILRSAG